MDEPRERNRRRFTTKLVFGSLLMVFGVVVLLHNLRIMDIDRTARFFPLALVVIGIERMVSKGFLKATGGHVLAMLGIGFLALTLEQELLLETWWPVGLVWIGVILTLRAVWPAPKPEPTHESLCQDSNERLS